MWSAGAVARLQQDRTSGTSHCGTGCQEPQPEVQGGIRFEMIAWEVGGRPDARLCSGRMPKQIHTTLNCISSLHGTVTVSMAKQSVSSPQRTVRWCPCSHTGGTLLHLTCILGAQSQYLSRMLAVSCCTNRSSTQLVAQWQGWP